MVASIKDETSALRYVSNVALTAAFSALDIGLSQWSFEYITISLYTMTKTTSIIFILVFAIFLKLEEKVSFNFFDLNGFSALFLCGTQEKH